MTPASALVNKDNHTRLQWKKVDSARCEDDPNQIGQLHQSVAKRGYREQDIASAMQGFVANGRIDEVEVEEPASDRDEGDDPAGNHHFRDDPVEIFVRLVVLNVVGLMGLKGTSCTWHKSELTGFTAALSFDIFDKILQSSY